MNKRQIKKQRKMRNKRLVKQYPFLLPRDVYSDKVPDNYDYEYTEYDNLVPGWQIGFGKLLLEDLKIACLKTGWLHKLHIEQLKEKYGSMRMYINYAPKKVNDVIRDYEYISQYICGQCGSIHGCVINNRGWYFPLCKKCYEANNKRRKMNGYRVVPWEEVYKVNESGLPDSYQVTRFSRDGNKVVIYDISEKIEKIKKKYYKRHKE